MTLRMLRKRRKSSRARRSFRVLLRLLFLFVKAKGDRDFDGWLACVSPPYLS